MTERIRMTNPDPLLKLVVEHSAAYFDPLPDAEKRTAVRDLGGFENRLDELDVLAGDAKTNAETDLWFDLVVFFRKHPALKSLLPSDLLMAMVSAPVPPEPKPGVSGGLPNSDEPIRNRFIRDVQDKRKQYPPATPNPASTDVERR